MVGAYMKLNQVTIPDTYPLSNIQNIFDHVRGSRYFSTMDLKAGFFGVQLDEESQLKTTFKCEYGLTVGRGCVWVPRAVLILSVESWNQFCRNS